jgi:hypothetical protein
MREAEVRSMHEANARRNALLFSQWEFLKTRQEAFEIALKASSLMARIKWFFSPQKMIGIIDKIQLGLLAEGQKKAQDAAAKPKLTVVKA